LLRIINFLFLTLLYFLIIVGGQFWQLKQSEIERSRQADREEINRLLDSKSDQQD
jgi:hypothetical protein